MKAKGNMTLVSENVMGLGRVLQVWTSNVRADVEGFGWNWNEPRFEDGVWGNTKTVITHRANPHRGELSG